MDSLTTAYVVCMLIGSIGSFVAVYAGNRMYPIESSQSSPLETPTETPSQPQQNTEQIQLTSPSVSS